MTTRIPNLALIDDHHIVRSGLIRLLETGGQRKVMAQYSNGADFVAAFPWQSVPDLIILDLSMPVMDGFAVLQWMREQQLSIPVLALTFQLDSQVVHRLQQLGADSWLEKSCTFSELSAAIDRIVPAAPFGQPAVTVPVESRFHPLTRLTAREQEFLRLVSSEEEYTYKEIAAHMGVHPRTVDGYREALFHKLQVKARSGLILYALKHQLA